MPGVLAHLDHLQWLGVNTIWFNPCFASPFVDAGYDVSDYLTVAPRYGTNDDLIAVIDAARERGIRVVLDLVAGHTSIEHAWFQAELHADGPDPTGRPLHLVAMCASAQRNSEGAPGEIAVGAIARAAPRLLPEELLRRAAGAEFRLRQRCVDDEPWRQPVDAPGPLRNRQALRDIMAFWLDRGVAGFRVDMAFSLVKDDPGICRDHASCGGICAAGWTATYPDAVIIPEGVEPHSDFAPAFHADFQLVIFPAHARCSTTAAPAGCTMVPPAPCFFDAEGLGSTAVFLDAWDEPSAQPGPAGRSCWPRPTTTSPGWPAGPGPPSNSAPRSRSCSPGGRCRRSTTATRSAMRYQPGLPNVEGSEILPRLLQPGRLPNPDAVGRPANAGFSTAPAEALYLPIDPAADRPTVAAQLADPDSVLHLVRTLIALRRAHPALGARALDPGAARRLPVRLPARTRPIWWWSIRVGRTRPST